MLFALVLGLLVGGGAVMLIEQWLRDALEGDAPAREFTPSGAAVHRTGRRRAA